MTQALLDKLTKVGLLVAHFNIPRREVPDHAGDTRECRCGQNVVGEDIEQFVFRVGAPRAVLVLCAKARALDERAGIELDLVGLERSFTHKAYVIEFILLGRGAQKICHCMCMDLKAKDAQQVKRLGDTLEPDAALVEVENVLVQALYAHLDLRGAQAANERQCLRRHRVGTRLDHKPHHAMSGGLVDTLLALELLERAHLELRRPSPRGVFTVELRHAAIVRGIRIGHVVDALLPRCDPARNHLCVRRDAKLAIACAPVENHLRNLVRIGLLQQLRRAFARGRTRVCEHGICRHTRHGVVVEGTKELGHKPDLVLARIVAPGTAEHDELNLIGRMPHLRERR